MSRIFGAAGKITEDLLAKFDTPESKSDHIHFGNLFYLSCGGPEGTYTFYKAKDPADEGFALIGSVLEFTSNKFSIPEAGALLKNLPVRSYRDSLDGNYCGVHWKEGKITLFSDQSGIFDLFYFQKEGTTFFSNDLIYLTSFAEGFELNTKIFSTRWLSVNQFSADCIVKNVHRLCKGESLTIEDNGSFTLSARKVDDDHKITSLSVSELLTGLFNVLTNSGYHISLSLSGGIDSRFLLAILLSIKSKNFSTHTFGSPEDQDSVVASQISKAAGIPHQQLFEPEMNTDECISLMKNYVRSTQCISPASAIFRLKYYQQLYGIKNIVIDGGFGEIGRRQYLNRLLFKKKSAVLIEDTDVIFDYTRLDRADIFNAETKLRMTSDAKDQIKRLTGELPAAKHIGAENWADTFSYHTRLPNFFGIEQMRIQKYVNSLMPFGMKNIYQSIMNIDLRQRKNGNAFKKIIAEKSGKLSEIPLAKDDAVYAFNSGFLTSRLRIKYQKLRTRESPVDEYKYLKKVRDFTLGLLYSKSTKNFELYDYNKISKNVAGFYNGNNEFAKFTDWWLTFEIMRRFIYKESF